MNSTQHDHARNPSPALTTPLPAPAPTPEPPPVVPDVDPCEAEDETAMYIGTLAIPLRKTVAEFVGHGTARHGDSFYSLCLLAAIREYGTLCRSCGSDD